MQERSFAGDLQTQALRRIGGNLGPGTSEPRDGDVSRNDRGGVILAPMIG
jgi:hypothetical protein